MLLRCCCLLSAGLILQGSTPPSKSWIADVKAAQETLGTREVLIEGDVVDIRSTSPAARAGFYRIIDASDPEGVLLRTDRLPRDGGELRVHARMAAQQPAEGPLLLDEVQQERIDQRPVTPLIVGVLSVVVLLLVTIALVRAAIEERKIKLSPPLWLLPEAGPYGKSLALPNAATPALQYSPELEEADRVRREQLRRRKRSLFRAMLGSWVMAGLSVAWFMVTEPAQAQVPAFIFIEANDTPIPVAQTRPDSAPRVSQAVIDSMMLVAMKKAAAEPDLPRRTDPRKDSTSRGRGAEDGGRGADSLPSGTIPVFTPPPSPAPSPPPPPPPPPNNPPPRDPEADRVVVSQLLTTSAGRLVDAINSKRWDNVARLLPEGISGDLKRRERFMKFLRDYSPRASLAGVESTTLAEEQGEAKFTVQFDYRGDFGVGDRKSGRFSAIAARSGAEWRFEGARLLNALP
jgi:hypothetical protein